MVKNMKKEKTEFGSGDGTQQGSGLECSAIRSRYNAVKNLLSGDSDDITKVGSDKFKFIIDEVDNLHEHVHKPKQQVADAEGFLDITNTLVTLMRAHNNGGITPADFINGLFSKFGDKNSDNNIIEQEAIDSLNWKDIGLAVSPVFRKCSGCRTMLGAMNHDSKQHKTVGSKRHLRKCKLSISRPKELDDESEEEAKEKKETDMIIGIMFEVLKKNRQIRLENLVLNRSSFAQTVENLFALSFLVKDGRVQITVDNNGHHLVSPRNAPSASAVLSKEAYFSHFVFRFDCRDWKLMMDSVESGDEKMPHRNPGNAFDCIFVPDSSPVETKPSTSKRSVHKFAAKNILSF